MLWMYFVRGGGVFNFSSEPVYFRHMKLQRVINSVLRYVTRDEKQQLTNLPPGFLQEEILLPCSQMFDPTCFCCGLADCVSCLCGCSENKHVFEGNKWRK